MGSRKTENSGNRHGITPKKTIPVQHYPLQNPLQNHPSDKKGSYWKNAYSHVGKEYQRVDAWEKVTGRARFGADTRFSGELTAKSLYSSMPRGKILNIDTSKAEALPGVAAVITAADVPGSNVLDGRFQVLAESEVKYIGDAIAAVAADSPKTAQKALKLIEYEIEPIPGVWNLEQADNNNIPPVHSDMPDNAMENTYLPLRKGNTADRMTQADHILERVYTVGFQEQAYIEPESITALPAQFHHGVEVYGCVQNPYTLRKSTAEALGLPQSHVRVVLTAIGGSFGGKDESTVLMASRCSILALKTGRPVRMDLSREECFLESCKRHPFQMEYVLGLQNDGTIPAIEAKVTCQGGPYNNKAQFSNWRAVIHTSGPYRIPNIRADVFGRYTNTIYGGAYRGFSGPQIQFGIETLIDEAAAYLKMNPKDFRLMNVYREGDTTSCGQLLKEGQISAPLGLMIRETCDRADFDRKWLEWPEHAEQVPLSGSGRIPGNVKSVGSAGSEESEKLIQQTGEDQSIRRGIGLAVTYRGSGLGGEGLDTSSAMITICGDGSVMLFSGHTEMGQGMRTAHAQIAAEALGIDPRRIAFRHSDTSITLDGGPTVASRGTQSGGRAVLDAACRLKTRLITAASKKHELPEDRLDIIRDSLIDTGSGEFLCSFTELIDYCIYPLGTNLSAQGWYNPGLYHIDEETQQGDCYQTYTHGAAAAEITVDTVTGRISVDRITVSYELGTAINPQLAYGQFAGGLLQGVGYALFEEMHEHEGYLKTLNFDDYLIPTAMDIPQLDIKLYETENPEGPYGAKGIGEIGIELAAPAIGNAIFHATGKRLRDLPFSLERVVLGKSLEKR